MLLDRPKKTKSMMAGLYQFPREAATFAARHLHQ
jgi:hypothetical protein